VALANRKRVDSSTLCSSEGCIRCAPKWNTTFRTKIVGGLG